MLPGGPARLSNVVFMGMGEPLANYGALSEAVRRLVGMLARKGHSGGVAYRVVREELGADLVDPEHSGP